MIVVGSRVPRHRSLTLLGLLVVAGPGGAMAQASDPDRSFDLRVLAAPAIVPVDGERLLVYELHLTNFSADTLTVDRVEVFGGDNRVTRLVADSLEAHLAVVGGPTATRTIAPGERGVLYLEISVGGDAPPTLVHRLAYRANDGNPRTVEGGAVGVAEDPPVLGPPLRGGPWVAVYHPSWERGHRRVFYTVGGWARIPGRHAIDWFRVDRKGRVAGGGIDSIVNWHGYRADVLAVADAVVTATRDDVTESPTLSGYTRPSLADATGNYISLDLGGGRYAHYEHLAPGSVRVSHGDRVSKGQIIAALGFTGSTTGPHLHFHIADANSPLGAEGVPFVLEGFTVLGRYQDLSTFRMAPWTPAAPQTTPVRVRELPGPNMVVELPGRP